MRNRSFTFDDSIENRSFKSEKINYIEKSEIPSRKSTFSIQRDNVLLETTLFRSKIPLEKERSRFSI